MPLTIADLEKLLVDVGALNVSDSRMRRERGNVAETSSSKIRRGNTGADDDDSDWE